MFDDMQNIYLAIPLLCLFAAVVAGIFGKQIGRIGAHTITIVAVGIAFALSVLVYIDVLNGNVFNGGVYTWGISAGTPFEIGFLIDELSATMMVVVTFVSWMVHIYTIGYMRDDPGYQRFFSYISLFTFAMLMLVMANNFLQLFFGWEAVGLLSYLLIGFWFEKDTAIYANLKAFLVNRVGDFGFLLGIAAILFMFGTLDYVAVFTSAPHIVGETVSPFGSVQWQWISVICICLFIGAMGKSAQVPLHVWLPDSMEGPTPISALIHAATMVTAGIFMVARMSPLFELSEAALSMVMIVGALTAFFMALIGMVQNDIKRVVAYSTLSQLGYMTVALGASAYAAGIFHLSTHAFFKALLFLGAGSVIIAMHHEQDMRKMGGLRRAMPITWLTVFIGSLALAGIPPFAGFFSKDLIIEAVHHSTLFGSGIAYAAVLSGVFITAFYSFRLVFLVFHGRPRMDEQTRKHLKESPMVVVLPLVLLAVPSVVAGMYYFEPVLLSEYFGDSIRVLESHDSIAQVAAASGGERGFSLIISTIKHGFMAPPLYLALGGIALAWLCYIKNPALPERATMRFNWLHTVLMEKYGIDRFYDWLFAGGTRKLGNFLWRGIDVAIIDSTAVDGTARVVNWVANRIRVVQSGYIYHYAFAMIIGLFAFLSWLLFI